MTHIKNVWHPEVNNFSKEFTQVLVRLKSEKHVDVNQNKKYIASLKQGKAMQKDLGLTNHFVCDSLTYCETNGKKGKVEKVFSNAVSANLKRNLSTEQAPKWVCDCNKKEETFNIDDEI